MYWPIKPLLFSRITLSHLDKTFIADEASRMADFEWFLAQDVAAEPRSDTNFMTIANASRYFPATAWNLIALLEGYATDLPEVQKLFENQEYELKFNFPQNFKNFLIRLDKAINGEY